MENTTLKVTRRMMIEALDKRTEGMGGNCELRIHRKPNGGWYAPSFSDYGRVRRNTIAISLYNRLVDGGTPTTNEVVAYFGKGARFVEDK